MRILITGGAGFIGSNLAHALADDHVVGVIDDLSTGHAANLVPGAWFRRLDILDADLAAAMAEFGPDVVVHLAAQASVSVSVRDPEFDRRVNVDGTEAVARAAMHAGARRVLSASSAAIYGEPESLPLPETARKAPESPYGLSKLRAEDALVSALAGSHADYASLRFANVYGPRQDAAGEGGAVSIFCDRMAAGEPPTVFGTGEQTRDFIYVGDVVDAIVAAACSAGALPSGPGDGAAFNISTGRRTSVLELLAALREASGYRGETTFAPERDGDIMHSALDPSKAREVLGWSDGVGLCEGAARTYAWFAGRT